MLRNLVSPRDPAKGEWDYEQIFYKDPKSLTLKTRLDRLIHMCFQHIWYMMSYSNYKIPLWLIMCLIICMDFNMRKSASLTFYDKLQFVLALASFCSALYYMTKYLLCQPKKTAKMIEAEEREIARLKVPIEETRTESYRRETFQRAAGFSINDFAVVPKRQEPVSVEPVALESPILPPRRDQIFTSTPIARNRKASTDPVIEIMKMKRFLYEFMFRDLIGHIEELKFQLERGLVPFTIETMSIDTMRSLASNPYVVKYCVPMLPKILNGIDFNHQINLPYFFREVMSLPRYLLADSLQNEEQQRQRTYTERKPSLNYIVFKLFSNFMDINLLYHPDCGIPQAFSKNFTVVEGRYSYYRKRKATPLLMRCSDREDPTFALYVDDAWKKFPKTDGVYYIILEFFRSLRDKYDSVLCGCNLESLCNYIFNWLEKEDLGFNCVETIGINA